MADEATQFQLERRAAILGGLASLLMALPAAAQQSAGGGGRMTTARLNQLIAEALNDEQEVKLARPWIFGLTETDVVTRQVSRTVRGANCYFAVVVPQRQDGLLFFRGTEEPLLWAMHRTGTHLRRLVSGRNQDGKLSSWTGRDADRDFESQLAAWV